MIFIQNGRDDGIENARIKDRKLGGEVRAIQFSRLAVFLVQYVFMVTAERRGLACVRKSGQLIVVRIQKIDETTKVQTLGAELWIVIRTRKSYETHEELSLVR